MPPIPPVAQEAPAEQDSPLRTWLDGWLAYLIDHLPTVFVVVAVVVGILLLVRSGIKQTVLFAVGAALVYLLLTNLPSTAEFFQDELPMPPAEVPEPPTPG